MVSFVFHGDDISASRTALLIKLAEYKKQGVVIETIDGSKLDDLSMENLQASQELFGDPKVFLIENAHAGHKSKKRDELIKTLQDLDSEIVLWDKKKLTALMLKNFPLAQVSVHNSKNYLWAFLDSLSPHEADKVKMLILFKNTLAENEVYYVFIMICWQLRQLIGAAEGHYAGMPAKKNYVLQKGADFGLEKLLKFHQELLRLDVAYKTSKLKLPLEQEIQWLLGSL